MQTFKEHLMRFPFRNWFSLGHNCTYFPPFIQEVHEDPGQAPLSTSHPEGPVPAPSAPEPAPAAGSQAEKAVPSKSLLEWLRQQADYSLDVPGFGAVSVVGTA